MDNTTVREGWLKKRSINRSRFGRTNYRHRWFILTQRELKYLDNHPQKKGHEKGCIALIDVKVIETVDGNNFDSNYGIQIVYSDSSNGDLTLYFFPENQRDRDAWLEDLRKLCSNNNSLSLKYHAGIWKEGKWTCCSQAHHGAPGCRPTFLKEQLPLPPVPNRPNIPEEAQNFIAVAKYEYNPVEPTDIKLVRGEEYIILDSSRDFWWKARNKHGQEGFIPSNYVEEKTKFNTGLEQFDWFRGSWSRPRAEMELKAENREGCFIVRNSSTPGRYTVSILTKNASHSDDFEVKHYHIKINDDGEYFISQAHTFTDVPSLVQYHSYNAGGLVTRLRTPPGQIPPETAGLGSAKYEISRAELHIFRELGSGQFGVVHLAKHIQLDKFVAVKTMKKDAMSEEEFIQEARNMKEFQHENLVQLYGVCTDSAHPLAIVTEFMSKGCLLFYLRRHADLWEKANVLIHYTQQIASAMKYLESKKFIHRDLAARNCLVGEKNVVKVADFGLTRYVLDDQYTSSGAKFPIKWAPPEVLHYTRFSSKSDVWAFGILMWEVFSGGKTPYPTMSNVEVVSQVTRGGYRMEQPDYCPRPVYKIMRDCWEEKPDDRPSFKILLSRIMHLSNYDETDIMH